MSATCISTEAAEYLEANSDLLPHHVSEREVLRDSIVSMLHESQRIRARIVRANQLQEKLTFVLDTVEQWISCGGLGCTNADEKLYWEGLVVKDCARKVDRVTVGRSGGDDIRP